MIEAILLAVLFHFIGDYVTQSDWMANKKVRGSSSPGEAIFAATSHGIIYTIPFTLLTLNVFALLIICITHIVIDHFRLARYVVFAKNFLAPKKYWPRWSESSKTGYPDSRPDWLAVWLMIIADNILHIIINTVTIIMFGITL